MSPNWIIGMSPNENTKLLMSILKKFLLEIIKLIVTLFPDFCHFSYYFTKKIMFG